MVQKSNTPHQAKQDVNLDDVNPADQSEADIDPDQDTILKISKELGAEKSVTNKHISKKDEYALILAWQERRDESAINQLLKVHGGWLNKTVLKYGKTDGAIDFDDVFQEARMGFVKAIERFDFSSDVRLLTYATWWMRQAITRYLGDHARDVRLPVHTVEKVNKLKRAIAETTKKTGRKPTNAELAKKMSLPVEKILHLKEISQSSLSLDKKVGNHDDGGSTLIELLEDTKTPTPYDIVAQASDLKYLQKLLDNASLSETEREVINMRYLSSDQEMRTLNEVGEKLGVTRERIRQIESIALTKLFNKTGQSKYNLSAPKIARAAQPLVVAPMLSIPSGHQNGRDLCSMTSLIDYGWEHIQWVRKNDKPLQIVDADGEPQGILLPTTMIAGLVKNIRAYTWMNRPYHYLSSKFNDLRETAHAKNIFVLSHLDDPVLVYLSNDWADKVYPKPAASTPSLQSAFDKVSATALEEIVAVPVEQLAAANLNGVQPNPL